MTTPRVLRVRLGMATGMAVAVRDALRAVSSTWLSAVRESVALVPSLRRGSHERSTPMAWAATSGAADARSARLT